MSRYEMGVDMARKGADRTVVSGMEKQQRADAEIIADRAAATLDEMTEEIRDHWGEHVAGAYADAVLRLVAADLTGRITEED